MKRHATLITLVAGAVMAFAPAASASIIGTSGDFSYAKGTAKLPAAGVSSGISTHARAEVRCPAGMAPTSGGAEVSNGPGDAHLATLAGAGRSWLAGGWHINDKRRALKAWAVCAPKSEVHVVTATKKIAKGEFSAGTSVECDTGSATGGGAILRGKPEAWSVNSSLPVDDPQDADSVADDIWTFIAGHRRPARTKVTAQAVCLDRSVQVGEVQTVLPEGGTASLTAECPQGLNAVGGGGYLSGSVKTTWLTASTPWDSSDVGAIPDNGWIVQARNASSGPTTVIARAVCA